MGVLIDGATASDSTKIEFTLRSENFPGSGLPAVKTVGLGAGDSVNIYESINSSWETGITLDSSNKNTVIMSTGKYAVDITMATAGPASVLLDLPNE